MSQKSLPKRHETFIPILEAIQEREILSVNEIAERVVNNHYPNLPPDILTARLKSGQLKIVNEIWWAISALGRAKLVSTPERGNRQITDKGLAVLATGSYTPQDLHSDSDFIAYGRELKSGGKPKTASQPDTAALSDNSPNEMIEQGISQIEKQAKAGLLDRLSQIHWYDFERVILVLLEKMGYGSFKTTPKSNDGGIDGIVNQDELGIERIYIQAKQYNESSLVRSDDMKKFIGSLSVFSIRKGVFATTSGFDRKSQELAEKAEGYKIILIDGIELTNLMYKHNCGVRPIQSYEIKEVDTGFFDGQNSE